MALDPIAQTLCPVPLKLAAIRGDSIDVRIRLINGATAAPIVLTGYSGTASIYASSNASVAVHTLTVDVDQSGAGLPTTGVITVTLAGGVSVTWIEAGFWALVIDNGTVRKTIVAGPWELKPYAPTVGDFVCGLCPTASSGAELIGSGCEVLTQGYTGIVLPYPQGECSC